MGLCCSGSCWLELYSYAIFCSAVGLSTATLTARTRRPFRAGQRSADQHLKIFISAVQGAWEMQDEASGEELTSAQLSVDSAEARMGSSKSWWQTFFEVGLAPGAAHGSIGKCRCMHLTCSVQVRSLLIKSA